MNDRIKKVITHYHLTASQFATEIGIQRSALSHIMSGRNKPSLDFVLKLKHRFNEINTDWLLWGKGMMLDGSSTLKKEEVKQGVLNLPVDDISEEGVLPMAQSEEPAVYAKAVGKSSNVSKKKSPGSVDQGDLEIEKIIIFYKNGRFKSYQPE
ncbi:MAG: hypothetical protein DRJ09_01350 [Bacteroidetes bacterium]|nr:MAG: hypothetical protein DRJ09_01350 [Bacteroidota bacterium]